MGILSEILEQSQLSGGVFFCHTFNDTWGLDVKMPQSGIFHILLEGFAVIGHDDQQIQLKPGDIVILPKPYPHWIAYNKETTRKPIMDFRNEYLNKPFNNKVSSTDKTTLLCGFINFNDPTHFPLFKELPTSIHIPSKPKNHINWLQSLVKRMNSEAINQPIGSVLYLNRQVELLFIDILRHWLAQDKTNSLLLRAAQNPMILQTLNLFHAHPEKDYKLETLALEVGMSRANLSKKFTEIVGLSPMAYLSKWRVYKASSLLTSTNLPLIDIALSVGYSSTSALSKKFKSELGVSPNKYRKLQNLKKNAPQM